MKMSKRLTILLLLGVAALPAAPQQRTEKKQAKPAETTSGDGRESKPTPATTDPGYVIGAEDVIAINVWKEPEISRAVPVRPDGKISLPLINDVQAAGLTPTQLASLITEKLKKYAADPQVTVIVQAINSRRIYILGEVNHAGIINLLPNMTVLQALANSGGFTQFADPKKIYVLRNENGQQVKMPFNYKEVLRGQRPEQNIVLKPGDTIVVP